MRSVARKARAAMVDDAKPHSIRVICLPGSKPVSPPTVYLDPDTSGEGVAMSMKIGLQAETDPVEDEVVQDGPLRSSEPNSWSVERAFDDAASILYKVYSV